MPRRPPVPNGSTCQYSDSSSLKARDSIFWASSGRYAAYPDSSSQRLRLETAGPDSCPPAPAA
ncbi:MAG: hypothetical protein ACKOFW_02360 [Planctomycetaceae bacterium]